MKNVIRSILSWFTVKAPQMPAAEVKDNWTSVDTSTEKPAYVQLSDNLAVPLTRQYVEFRIGRDQSGDRVLFIEWITQTGKIRTAQTGEIIHYSADAIANELTSGRSIRNYVQGYKESLYICSQLIADGILTADYKLSANTDAMAAD
jgi:hypothetical protein